MPSSDWARAVGPALEGQPASRETWVAVLLICASTLTGAWLARRNSQRMTLWLAVASAMMLVTALVDLLPDAWSESIQAGVPLWAPALAATFGFLVITYFTRKGCGHGHDHSEREGGAHAPGRHRRVKEAINAALFGGMGTAAALTLHRAIEGATLALTASVVVVIALTIHSASEGLALAALLDMARQRLAPWLVVSCVSPAVGVLLATLSPLPAPLVPILLSMVMGVLLRTAIVGMKLAAGRQRSGRLSKRQIAVAAAAAGVAGTLLATANILHAEDGALPSSPSTGLAMQDYARLAPSQPASGASSTPVGPFAGANGQAEFQAAIASGRLTLTEVFQRNDDLIKRTPIGRILRALPGHSKDKVTALIAASGVDEERQVADLTEPQRRKLLKVFGR
ncbi:hypothetical protein ACFY05_01695 [Microtetraspora fusca]|uniref:Zinc transporter ZupT n=1 Tax=Microtetraspora fusca TaxID=1997 RepID=A0ABW6UWW9_MICFU